MAYEWLNFCLFSGVDGLKIPFMVENSVPPKATVLNIDVEKYEHNLTEPDPYYYD